MAYTLETIIVEKLESIISKNIINTRARDYYDIYIIINNHLDLLNIENLIKGIKRTFKNRNTSLELKDMFNNYKKKLLYANKVDYEDTIKTIEKVINILKNNMNKESINDNTIVS